MPRPISQTGIPSVPTSPNARRHFYGAPRPRWKLEKVNERLSKEGRMLHPTKGFRRLNPERSQAEVLTAGMLSGKRFFSTKTLKETIFGLRHWLQINRQSEGRNT